MPSSSLPVIASIHWAAITSATSSPAVGQRPQLAQRRLGRAGADDAVAAPVAVVELALEQAQRGLVFVDDEQDGDGHATERTVPVLVRHPQNRPATAGRLASASMAGGDVELYFDLGSPYAHLAVARAERVLGRPPRPAPGPARGDLRGPRLRLLVAERPARGADRRARGACGALRPAAVRLAAGWPLDGLAAMRACVWAEEQGALDRFARAAFEHEFGRGEDISGVPALAAIAAEVGLPGGELEEAVASAPVKARLRELTEAAWERGVRGIPTVALGETLIYGDDQLEQVPLILAG